MNGTATRPGRLQLAEALGVLSGALDLAAGQTVGHALRCCWIGMEMARLLQLDAAESCDVYHTLLLSNLGCSAIAPRLYTLYGTEELTLQRDLLSVDFSSQTQRLRYVLWHVGARQKVRDRLQQVQQLLNHGDELHRELVLARSLAGRAACRMLELGERVEVAIGAVDERWDGRGLPDGRAGQAIPLVSRIAGLVRLFESLHRQEGAAAAMDEVGRRGGSWFDPELVRLLRDLADAPSWWSSLAADDLRTRVAESFPGAGLTVDDARMDTLAATFASLTDAKSRHTCGHSHRVADLCERIAGELGFPPARRRVLRWCALLHDLGKLGVGTGLLDGTEPLSVAAASVVQQHTSLGELLIARLPRWAGLARVIGSHHEQLDGGGFPRGLRGGALSGESRVLAVAEAFDTATSPRARRGAVPVEEALARLQALRGGALDADAIDALLAVAPADDSRTKSSTTAAS